MQKETYFLNYNKDNIFANLLQAEDHLRHLQSADNLTPGFQACVLKHLAFISGECLEAQSHSLVTLGKETSRKYAELQTKVDEIKKGVQTGKLSADEGILKVREARKLFEKINPDYDMESCQACGNMEDTARMVKSLKPIDGVEDDMVSRTVTFLSEKYGVTPPRVEILPECHNPEQGLYTNKTIRLCSGGASMRVLSHEFSHYLQDLNGKSLDEDEAERFSLDFLEKDLNVKSANYTASENKMGVSSAKMKMVAVVYASPFIAYGASRLLDMANVQFSKAKLIGDIALAGLGIFTLVKWLGTKNEPIALAAGIVGAIATTDLVVNQIPLALAPVTTSRLKMAANNNVNTNTPTVTKTAQNTATGTVKQGSLGKYAMTAR